MNNRLIVFILFISLACNRHKIALEKVSYLPDYFSASKHFGKDLKSIDERNEFILVTGMIDTTSEKPPIKLAVISIDNNEIYLNLGTAGTNNGEITEMYSGNGYVLNLTYKQKEESGHGLICEGYLAIEYDKLKSEYKILGISGYH